MRIVVTLLAVMALSACAIKLTKEEAAECKGDVKCLAHSLEVKIEEAEYRREVARINYIEQYRRDEAICNARGESIWITRRGPAPHCRTGDCPPRFGDSYTCGPPLSMQGY